MAFNVFSLCDGSRSYETPSIVFVGIGYYDHPPEWYDETGDYPDDDDNADETTPFFPSSSTPTPEFQTAQKEKGGFLDLPAVPSFSEELTALPSLLSTTKAAEGEIDKEFPNADKNKIKFMMDGKGRTRVGLISPKKPFYNLLTQIPGKSGEYRINPSLPKEVLRSLGESRRQTIQEERKKEGFQKELLKIKK